MKYLTIVDDEFLSYFRLDDDGKTLVVTDLGGCGRAMELQRLQLPVVTFPNGENVYLTQGHLDALLEYEQRVSMAEAIRHVNESIDEMNKACNKFPKIEPIAIGQGCYKCPSHTKCSDAFQIHSHKCNHYDKTDEEFYAWIRGKKKDGLC